MQKILDLDPTTAIIVLSTWMLISAFPLLVPTLVNANYLYIILDHKIFAAWVWGLILVTLAIGMIASTQTQFLFIRSTVMAFSSWIWSIIGLWILLTGYKQDGEVTAVGLFWLFGSVKCLFAMQQWIRHP